MHATGGRVGFLCEVDGDFVTDQQCLDCALHMRQRVDRHGVSRHCQWNYPYINSIVKAKEGRKNAGISTTNLVGCLRKTTWEKTTYYAQFPHEFMASGKGTAWHNHMEAHNENLSTLIAEVRIAKKLPNGLVITGQMDRYRRDLALIEDYKTKEDHLFYEGPLGYVAQLNIYAWMIRTGCIILETGELLQGPVEELLLYPSTHKEGGAVPVEMWPDEVVEALLMETASIVIAGIEDPTTPVIRSMEPVESPLCRGYCQFYTMCKKVGGKPSHPLDKFEKPTA